MRTLQDLLDVIGDDKREEIISKEMEVILKEPVLKYEDIEFLISIKRTEEAEQYILNRADRINGDDYPVLLSLVETFESEQRWLPTSLIYRELLVSILNRVNRNAYRHGVRYLKKLDNLSTFIKDWRDFENHETFKQNILQRHGRKRSFWAKYNT